MATASLPSDWSDATLRRDKESLAGKLVTEGDDWSRCAEFSRSSNSTALTPPRAVQARQHALRLAYRVARLSAIRRWRARRDVALQTGGGWVAEGGLRCCVRSRDKICRGFAQLHHRLVAQQRRRNLRFQ